MSRSILLNSFKEEPLGLDTVEKFHNGVVVLTLMYVSETKAVRIKFCQIVLHHLQINLP